jgi:hypothetical protein
METSIKDKHNMENNDLYAIDEKGNIIIDGSNPERARVIAQF